MNTAVGSMQSTTAHSAGAVGGLSTGGKLIPGSKGVFGIESLDIASSSANSTVITSSTRNVRLDSGTKMLLSNSAAGGMTASDTTQAAGSVNNGGAAKEPSGGTSAPAQKTRESGPKN